MNKLAAKLMQDFIDRERFLKLAKKRYHKRNDSIYASFKKRIEVLEAEADSDMQRYRIGYLTGDKNAVAEYSKKSMSLKEALHSLLVELGGRADGYNPKMRITEDGKIVLDYQQFKHIRILWIEAVEG